MSAERALQSVTDKAHSDMIVKLINQRGALIKGGGLQVLGAEAK